MIVGCNGGMQWFGAPSDFAMDYSYFCRIVNYNIGREEFLKAVSTCNEMVYPLYPSGVPRHTPRNV